MELPIAQYKRLRAAFTMLAVVGLGFAVWGACGFFKENGLSFWDWAFLAIGLFALVRCTWLALDKSVILELNREGIRYKQSFFAWEALRSLGIREETGESASFTYLVLHLKDAKDPLYIQLDWLGDHESLPEKMVAYAEYFHVGFDGVERKEI